MGSAPARSLSISLFAASLLCTDRGTDKPQRQDLATLLGVGAGARSEASCVPQRFVTHSTNTESQLFASGCGGPSGGRSSVTGSAP